MSRLTCINQATLYNTALIVYTSYAMTQILYQFKDDLKSLRSNLKFSYYEAFLSSFVIGLAESYFAAFAIAKGMNTLQSGLLTTLPLLFAGALNILFNVYFKKKTLSAHVQDNVLFQVFALIGMAYFAWTTYIPANIVFVGLLSLYSIYWYSFFSSQPVWNTWITEMVKSDESQDYFALRTRLTQLGVITGLLFGGGLLQLFSDRLGATDIFIIIFTVSAFCKILKYHYYQKHPASESKVQMSYSKIKDIFIRNQIFFKNYSLFNLTLFISAPYVSGYLLESKHLNYFHFMLVTIALYVGKIFTTLFTSLTEKDLNPFTMMLLGGLAAAPLPALWPICNTVETMILLQILSGAAWAFWEMGLALVFFKNIKKEEKIETITLYHTVGITTQVLGAIVGALLVKFIFQHNYNHIFVFAGAIRFAAFLGFFKNKKALE